MDHLEKSQHRGLGLQVAAEHADLFSVDSDVAVNAELASLQHAAGEQGPEDCSVQAAL